MLTLFRSFLYCVFALGIANYSHANTDDQWSDKFVNGLDSPRLGTALTIGADGAVYVGGAFATVAGVTVNSIARWDPVGETWAALGTGVDGDIHALTTGSDGSIYAAGQFTTAGGIVVNNIAKWDPVNEFWEELGSGIDFFVFALTTGLDGAIYAAGVFNNAGDVSASNIARWNPDTGQWAALGTGLNHRVLALATGDDGAIYAGGDFTLAGDEVVESIARWNPVSATWQSVGITTGGSTVSTLASGSNGSIYAGGFFVFNESTGDEDDTGDGDEEVEVRSNLAVFDINSSTWEPIAPAFEASSPSIGIGSLLVSENGTLYVGGTFIRVNTLDARSIAAFNPDTGIWTSLGSGLSTLPHALVESSDGLIYAAGGFRFAGSKSSNGFAIWNPDPVINEPPAILSEAAVEVLENQTVALDVDASDDSNSEGDGLSYSISGGADGGSFKLDAASGVLSFTNAPDYEIPGDANSDNDYDVQVTVTDEGGLSDVQDVVVSVTNEFDGTETDLAATVSGSDTVTLDGTSVDDNIVVTGLGSGTVSITDGANDGAPVGTFSDLTTLRINAMSGVNQITLVDVEIPSTLTVNGGGASDTVEITGSLSVGGGMNIDLSGGDNVFTASSDAIIDVVLNANIETNNGNDVVELPNITTGNHLDIDVGGGDDIVKLGIAGGNVYVDNRLTIHSGSGDNEITLIDVRVNNATQLFSGSGIDDYELTGTTVGGFMDVIAGSGNDGVVSESNNIGDEYNVNCGPGQDSFVSINDQGSPLKNKQCETVP